jgi:hypothetical protein
VSLVCFVFCCCFGTLLALSDGCMPRVQPVDPMLSPKWFVSQSHLSQLCVCLCLYLPAHDLNVFVSCHKVRLVLRLGCGCYLMLLGIATGCWLLAGTVYWLIG